MEFTPPARSREQCHPHPLRDVRKPERKYRCGGGNFRTYSNDLRNSVGGANRKACRWIEVIFCVNSKCAGNGMHDGHLRQHIGHDQGDGCSGR